MTKKIIALFGLVLASCVWAADTTLPTAERHQKMGVQCVSCHKDGNTALPVRKAQCQACHGSYESLAKRTEKVKPNPHYNHFGDRDCSTCHKGHQKSVTTCDTCHKFDLKTP